MLIDWFTVGAQALNFAILVWLMKRFLYRPILDAIDAREKHVAAALADADARKAEARHERDAFEQKHAELESQRAALVDKATREAAAERQRLIGEARQDAEALKAKQQQALRADVQRVGQALTQRTQQEVFAIARQALADLASADLEAQMAHAFVARLIAFDGAPRQQLAEALAAVTPADPALVRSAFELAPEQRAAIQKALNQAFAANVAVRFETAPELVGGIELSAKGRKLAWSISGYLSSLKEDVEALVEPGPPPEVASR